MTTGKQEKEKLRYVSHIQRHWPFLDKEGFYELKVTYGEGLILDT